jgi:hypothetical protein
MVCIKYVAHPANVRISSEAESMASDEALETSTQQREASTDPTLSRSIDESDRKSWSGDSEDSETASDDSKRLKVAALAAAGITYDFGASNIKKARIGSMENYARYFPKGYDRAPGVELVPEPRANEAFVFEDFFTAGLHMPPHPVLEDTLCKFHVQLHQLTSNAIVQISKFIWVVTFCGGHPTVDVFAQHYELHYQRKKVYLEGCTTTLRLNSGISRSIPVAIEAKRG